MNAFLKVSEAPKTKLQLKKAILNGTVLVYENNSNVNCVYTKVNDTNTIFKLWDGFHYTPKYQGENNEAYAYLGTSYYYKFTNV